MKVEFPACRGIQAGREYYIAMVPISVLKRLMVTREDDDDLPPDLRAQRSLNKSRVGKLAEYVTNNPREYTLSSLTASIDSDGLEFTPAEDRGSVGKLEFPLDARILINDGQHRFYGLIAALERDRDLEHETISVVLFHDAGLHRSQQMFTDLNRYAAKPSKAISLLYDHRDPVAVLSRRVIKDVPRLEKLIDTERSSVAAKSIKLHTLNNLYAANCRLAEGLPKKKARKLIAEFWNAVIDAIPAWNLVASREVLAADLRSQFLHAHGVGIEAIGVAMSGSIANGYCLQGLAGVDWDRGSRRWDGVIVVEGRIVKSRGAIQQLANHIAECTKAE